MTTAHDDGDDGRQPVWERTWVLWLSSFVLVAVVAAFAFMLLRPSGTGPSQATALTSTTSGVPTGMNVATANLMDVVPVPTDPVTMPAWHLTDQHGRTVSSAQLRGRVVVLTFNDDECTDLCVMMSSDIVQADKDLSATARSHVTFVSINANPYYPAVSDVAAWSDEHGLAALPNWEYVTGTPAQLAAQAHAYQVPIRLDPKTRTIRHGTQIFIISPQDKEVSMASFGPQSADTAPFAHGLAALADDALPAAQRGAVAGANLARTLHGGTALGDTPTSITGPDLAGGGRTLTTAADHGKYTVVDFWSSTCTACHIQLPDQQAEAKNIAGLPRGSDSVAFMGVDVDDTAAAGRATATRYRNTISTIRDHAGSQAARFRISQLPYTVILSPTGKVLVRHPGLFTTDELDYELHSLDGLLPGTSD